MASQPRAEQVDHAATEQEGTSAVAGWGGKIGERISQIKEHAESYPYVWGSYILVYGGFGLWLTYRWRKLRRTEDNVRVLQERLRKLVEAEQSNSSSVAVAAEKPVKSTLLANGSRPATDNHTKKTSITTL